MTRRNLYNYLFFIIPVVYFLSLPIATSDLAVWVAHGKYFLQTGTILRHDIYSFLPTKDLVYPFGASLLYGIIDHFTGLVGVSLFHKVVVLIISFVWFKSALSGPVSPWSNRTKFVVILSWFGSSLFCIDRPALLAVLPLVLSFLFLQKEEELSWRDLFWLNIINVVWVNFHGSWILLLVMYCWREFFRLMLLKEPFKWKSTIGALILVISSLLNPFSYKVFPYIFETAFISRERGFSEWEATSISGTYPSQAIVYYLLVVLIIIWGAYLIKSRHPKTKMFLASPFLLLLLLGVSGIRNTALAFFVFIPFASQFDLVLKEKGEKIFSRISLLFNSIIMTFVLVLLIAFLPQIKPVVKEFLPKSKQEVFDQYASFSLASYLNQTEDNWPVFNEWEYGSFLILSQKHRIFADTRNIIYSKESLAEYLDVISVNENWEMVLEKYGIRYILLSKNFRQKLIHAIDNTKKWEIVKEDEYTVLFKKRV